MNIALDYTGGTGDLDISGNRVKLNSGEQSIEQNLRVRLRFRLEEWFLDLSQGIPYDRDIFIKNPNMLLIESLYRQAIRSTRGISAVRELSATLNASERRLYLRFVATMDTGAPLVFDPFIVEI